MLCHFRREMLSYLAISIKFLKSIFMDADPGKPKKPRKNGCSTHMWEQSLEVEALIRKELDRWGLTHWHFFWDRGRRRLGACWYSKKAISLSRYLLGGDISPSSELWLTFLHELAHALAFIHHEERGHGDYWKHWCVHLGIEPERCAASSPLDESCYKYAMRRRDTGEIVARYYRKPHFKYPLQSLMIQGQPETKGTLELIPYPLDEPAND